MTSTTACLLWSSGGAHPYCRPRESTMSSSPLNRRRLLQAAGVAAVATALPGLVPSVAPVAGAAVVPPVRDDIGASAFSFDLGQVRLSTGRWLANQDRTLSYLRFVD